MDRGLRRLFHVRLLLILLSRLENLRFSPALGKIRGKHWSNRLDQCLETFKGEFQNRRLECRDEASNNLGQVDFLNHGVHLHRRDWVDYEYHHRLDFQWQSVL